MPTELEAEREAKAAETRRVELVKLAKLEIDLKLKQRQDARKAEVETLRASLAETEKRNTEEDADDVRRTAAVHAEIDRQETARAAAADKARVAEQAASTGRIPVSSPTPAAHTTPGPTPANPTPIVTTAPRDRP